METALGVLYVYLALSTAISLSMVASIFIELEKEPLDSSNWLHQWTNQYPNLSTIGLILLCIIIWPWIVSKVMESIDVVSGI